MTGDAAGRDKLPDGTAGLDEGTFRERCVAMGLEEDEIQTELERAREAAASGDVSFGEALDEALKEIAVRMGHEG